MIIVMSLFAKSSVFKFFHAKLFRFGEERFDGLVWTIGLTVERFLGGFLNLWIVDTGAVQFKYIYF